MARLVLVIALAACRLPAGDPVSAGRPPAGAPVVVVSQRNHPSHLAVAADRAYWIEVTDDVATVWMVEENHAPVVAMHATGTISAIAGEGDAVFAGIVPPDDGTIELRRIGTDRGIAIDARPLAMAIDHGDLYWMDGGGRIQKVAADGRAVTLVDNPEYSYASRFELDGRDIYFANELDDTPYRIYRVAKTGGAVTQVSALAHVDGWAIASSGAYYSAEGTIWKAAPEPVRVGSGRVVGVQGDRLLYADGKRLRERSIASGKVGTTDLALPDDIVETVVTANGVWFVRDTSADATGQVEMYRP